MQTMSVQTSKPGPVKDADRRPLHGHAGGPTLVRAFNMGAGLVKPEACADQIFARRVLPPRPVGTTFAGKTSAPSGTTEDLDTVGCRQKKPLRPLAVRWKASVSRFAAVPDGAKLFFREVVPTRLSGRVVSGVATAGCDCVARRSKVR